MKKKADKKTTKSKEIFGDRFVTYLRDKFQQRKTKNPRYSIRAFALSMELDPSSLSKVFAGTKNLSNETRVKCLEKLGASTKEMNLIMKADVTAAPKGHILPEDVLEVMSHWKYFAVLESTRIANDQSLFGVLKEKLGLDKTESQHILELLQRVQLLKLEDGKFETIEPTNAWTVDTSKIKTKVQKDVLERSLEALEETPRSLREHNSMLVAIDKRRLPEFKETLQKIKMELGDFFQSSTDVNDLYQFQMSFFPVTKQK